ncbi:MAG: hypothetical protein ACLQMF_00295 [Rectinemataceae bacterium]
MARNLTREFPDKTAATYAGFGKSAIFEKGRFVKKEREHIKKLGKAEEARTRIGEIAYKL